MAEPWNAHPLRQSDLIHAGPEPFHYAHDFMPRDQRELRFGQVTIANVEIGATDAARNDAEPNLTRSGFGIGQLARRERRTGFFQHHRAQMASARGRHFPLMTGGEQRGELLRQHSDHVGDFRPGDRFLKRFDHAARIETRHRVDRRFRGWRRAGRSR